MTQGKTQQEKKVNALLWRGILAERRMKLRVLTAGLLGVVALTLTVVQLGFAGIGVNGDYDAYAIVLLQPVALVALLFGPLTGALFGLFSGGALYVHALVMPLDYYELAFVTPFTSIIMLTLAGFLLGLLFAFALRKNPAQPHRAIRIVIICVVVSWLCSFGFVVNVIIETLKDMAELYARAGSEALIVDAARNETISMALRLGDMGLQAWVDALAMSVFCIAGDYLAAFVAKREQGMGIRMLFGGWLLVVVAVTFMATAAVSFVIITIDEYSQAEKSMKSEVEYLCNQLSDSGARTQELFDFFDSIGIDITEYNEEDLQKLIASLSTDNLLKGYSVEEDGLVLITFSTNYSFENEETLDQEYQVVYLSDDERIPKLLNLSDSTSPDFMAAITTSLETGKMQRVIYDGTFIPSAELGPETVGNLRTTLAYLYAQEVEGENVVILRSSDMVFENRSRVMAWTTIMSLVLLLVVFLLTFRLLNQAMIRRLDATNAVLKRITEGDLDARVDADEIRELSSLSDGINTTVEALKGWIAEAEMRMDAELAAAKAIQESALPRTFPPYPDILRFDIYALMNPAREVGGDFYDFFLIGDDSGNKSGKLGFVIADVSGKGVPAALFMMNAKTLVRGYMESGMELGEAIENANRKLCEGNDKGMFVTLFAGILDYGTFHVDFVNAGHNPPLLWQGDSWHWIKEKSGLPLGLFDGLPYKAHSVECKIGDQFLMYTDGVTEAMDVNGELFGEEHLEQVAVKHYPLHPRELTEVVRHEVARHAEGAEQSDDITILVLEVGVPPELTATLIVPADVNELARVNEFIHTELDRRLCPLRTQSQLDIAVEELFVNVAHYAYPEATPENPGMVRISYTYSAEPPSVTVDIADEGIPYNPLDKPDAVTPDDIMEVPIGGLGILMAKRSVDEMRYERIDGSNIVTIVKKW